MYEKNGKLEIKLEDNNKKILETLDHKFEAIESITKKQSENSLNLAIFHQS
jgi:hypothetical protein